MNVYIYIYVCKHTREVYAWMGVCILCMHVRTYVHVFMYVCMYVCMYVYVCVYGCMNVCM